MSLHFLSPKDKRLDWGLMAPQLVLALVVASECYAEEQEDCLVTCLDRHSPGVAPAGPEDFASNGFHSTGEAVDLSVRRYRGGEPIPEDKMDRIVARLEARLGRSGGGPFDVVDERKPRPDSPNRTGPHIHLEYQPL